MFPVAVMSERFSHSLSRKRTRELQRISTHFACTAFASAIRFVVGLCVAAVVSAAEVVVVDFVQFAVVSSVLVVVVVVSGAVVAAAVAIVVSAAVAVASATVVVATAMSVAAVVSPSSIPPPVAHRCLQQGDFPPPYPRLSFSTRLSGVRKTKAPPSFGHRLPSPPLNAPSLLPKTIAPCG